MLSYCYEFKLLGNYHWTEHRTKLYKKIDPQKKFESNLSI